jgi:hypothetical protein
MMNSLSFGSVFSSFPVLADFTPQNADPDPGSQSNAVPDRKHWYWVILCTVFRTVEILVPPLAAVCPSSGLRVAVAGTDGWIS